MRRISWCKHKDTYVRRVNFKRSFSIDTTMVISATLNENKLSEADVLIATDRLISIARLCESHQ